jgi:hypothetical protein
VLGAQVLAADLEVVPVVLACCEHHRQAVEAYQDNGLMQPERYPIHLAQELIAGLLESGDVHAHPSLLSA